MQPIHRYLGSLLLGAAIFVPTVATATPNPQDRDAQGEHQRRYYDREHRDYHVWNDREEGAFRRWAEEKHDQTHREFYRLKRSEQSEYWRWRHDHPDHDGDRH